MNEKLKQLRLKRNWSQAKAAKKAGIARTTFLEIEHGRVPELPTALKIADAFDIDDIAHLKDVFLT